MNDKSKHPWYRNYKIGASTVKPAFFQALERKQHSSTERKKKEKKMLFHFSLFSFSFFTV